MSNNLNSKNKYLIDPQYTLRKRAFKFFSTSLQPIVSLTSEVNISNLLAYSKKTGYKFNSLMCYYVLKACQPIKEFFYEIKNEIENGKEERKLYQYEKLCANIVVKGDDNQIYFCDIPFCDSFDEFNKEYMERTNKCKTKHVDIFCDDVSKIAFSVLTRIKITSAHNQYSGTFNKPFLVWGKYDEDGRLPISFNFHHLQMDGQHVEDAFINIQKEINQLNSSKM